MRQQRYSLSIVAVVVCLLCPHLLAGKTVKIGNGSGELNYPAAQATLNLEPGDTVYVNPGTYASLTMSKMAGTADAPITVTADPKAVFTTKDSHANPVRDLAFVVFDGLTYKDYNGNAMKIQGASHDLTFRNITCTNGGSFHIYDTAKAFDGSKDSTYYNLKWENCTFYGGATIWNEDWSPVTNLISLALDFEISHCTFSHYEAAKFPISPISMVKAFNLKVHDCTFSDVGVVPSPIGHGTVIGLKGYGQIHHNKFTRQWADDVRCFPLKLNALGYGGSDAVVRFYDNISYEKRKYAMFESNGNTPEVDKSNGLIARTGVEIYFNTLYRSRVVDYCAPLVDLYAPNATIRYNLVIEPECDKPWNEKYYRAPDAAWGTARNYVYNVGTEIGKSPNVIVDHNLVFKTIEESGLSTDETFTPAAASPVIDAGGKVDYITDDFYHKPRYQGRSADVGAVEKQ